MHADEANALIGKRVRGTIQGEIKGTRDGTITEIDFGVLEIPICIITWDDPRSVKGATLASHIHKILI